jgi:hypothetical protein
MMKQSQECERTVIPSPKLHWNWVMA